MALPLKVLTTQFKGLQEVKNITGNEEPDN